MNNFDGYPDDVDEINWYSELRKFTIGFLVVSSVFAVLGFLDFWFE